MPPLYLACAVMFWSWYAQVPALGVAVAVMLEAPRVVRARWHFGVAEYARIADLCTWAFVILAGYLTFTRGMPLPILEIFQWLPLIWLPLIAAQLFSETGQMPLSALFLMLRPGRSGAPEDRSIDLGYSYAVVCVLSAGAANVRQDSYYAGLLLLSAWALWRWRSPHYRGFVWMSVFVCAGALGYAGHLGLSRLQQIVMESTSSFFGGGSRVDPYKSTTDIGQLGELKQSDRIVLRATLPPDMKVPVLLHLASYNAYATPSWLARDATFVGVGAEPDRSSWVLPGAASRIEAATRDALLRIEAGPRGVLSRIEISQPVTRGKAVLALPGGILRVEQLPVPVMQRNPLGAVAIESPADLVIYQTVFDPHGGARDAPRDTDLRMPRQETAALEKIVAQLELKDRPAREVLPALKAYFQREFKYSTYLTASPSAEKSLADFLLVTRAGHCEYFATAATLLLRAAGVPARYATGYSVQEWSPLEERYIVRERHAHAWARAWVDGQWVDFDTTPPIWFSAEAQDTPRTQRLADLWSWVAYRYARWQIDDPAAYRNAGLGLIAVLAAVLIWRLFIRQPFAAARQRRPAAVVNRSRPGADSGFYQIEARLARAGCARMPHEPLGQWLARSGREHAEIDVAQLQELLRLHYRYRFDPLGLNAQERAAFAVEVQRWLQAHARLRVRN